MICSALRRMTDYPGDLDVSGMRRCDVIRGGGGGVPSQRNRPDHHNKHRNLMRESRAWKKPSISLHLTTGSPSALTYFCRGFFFGFLVFFRRRTCQRGFGPVSRKIRYPGRPPTASRKTLGRRESACPRTQRDLQPDDTFDTAAL